MNGMTFAQTVCSVYLVFPRCLCAFIFGYWALPGSQTMSHHAQGHKAGLPWFRKRGVDSPFVQPISYVLHCLSLPPTQQNLGRGTWVGVGGVWMPRLGVAVQVELAPGLWCLETREPARENTSCRNQNQEQGRILLKKPGTGGIRFGAIRQKYSNRLNLEEFFMLLPGQLFEG